MGLIDSIIGAESGGDANAKNPNSSASGAGQFIDSTWLDTIRKARPDLAEGKSDQELLSLKTDPQLSRQMTEAYAAQNGEILSKAGHPVTPGNTYLAHFAGPQGAVSVLSADPSTPIAQILTPGAVKANPFLQGMTAGDLRAWADRKMGGVQTAQVAPAAPATSVPIQIGQTAPPIFVRGPNSVGERVGDWAADQNLPTALNKSSLDMNPLGVNALGRATFGAGGSPNSRVDEGHRIINERTIAPPLNLAPQAPPIFAPPPQAQQPQQAQAEPAPFEQIPPMQMPPIFAPQRRSPDLSKLRAAFAQAPIFRRG